MTRQRTRSIPALTIPASTSALGDRRIAAGARRVQSGFTLIEALVALAVIALALSALLASGARMARDQQRLEQLSLAAYAADTVLTETRLKEAFPPIGRREGLTAIGRYRFRWEMVIQATPEAAIRRLDLHLYPDPRSAADAAIVSLSAFAGQP